MAPAAGRSRSDSFGRFEAIRAGEGGLRPFLWSQQSYRSRTCSRQNVRGTGFEPEPDVLAHFVRCARLVGLKSGRQSCRSRTCSRQNMRGTGFEPRPRTCACGAEPRSTSNPVRLPHSGRLAPLVGVRPVRGTGFKPDEDGRSLRSRCVFRGTNPVGSPAARGHAHDRTCVGPDLNRRTSTGQRPQRCAVGLAWLPTHSNPFCTNVSKSFGFNAFRSPWPRHRPPASARSFRRDFVS